ncbi:MAG: sugar transferase [Ignavibacteriales bacterium]|jgi:lipopolysaccharide/colanic/teichoic acid biosynthesis glycosyltransferase|nr:sugar transferase [Ignavibacteriaceae bacterium]NLH62537.1 sugar transferase [Ignavibacteriales bacterium]HOJ19233.1 sugar transferase [Ignavibacteriaceae bacterium]HPO56094.1 sugar transferase [Ignavibacteriaceae bacterium]
MHADLYRDRFKRIFDFTVSFIGVIILSPFFVLVGLIIKLSSPGSAIFTQERMGMGFIKFRLYKFRSMYPESSSRGLSITSTDDPRITPFGHFIRKFKLDELPQLINVIKGDMSLVGPRPEVERYVMIYKTDYEHILTVRPGITDIASLEFRNENELLLDCQDKEKKYIDEILPQKLALSRLYIKEHNFFLDFKIIIYTILGIDLKIKHLKQ